MKKLLLCLLMCLVLTGCQTPDTPEADPAVPDTVQNSAGAYLVVTAQGNVYEPLALSGEGRFRLTYGDNVNVVEVTENSVRMAESTCDNQDCVEQGTVTLENRSQRVLQNMIICMPNDVTLELYTHEEVLKRMEGYLGGQAE